MKNILVIGKTWPEPNSTAAGIRMLQLLELFKDQGFNIVFGATAKKGEKSFPLKTIGVKSKALILNSDSFDDFILNLKPEIVLFDRFMTEEQFGWRVDKFCPEALKILDTEDLHFLREARRQVYNSGADIKTTYLNAEITKREIAAIYRCDLSLIISEVEMDLLRTEFKLAKDLLYYLPLFTTDFSPEQSKELPYFEDRKDFISIGNFKHEPNWSAVRFLKEKIWPGIRKKLPQAQLHIYGAYATQKVLALEDEKNGFVIKGYAPSADMVMKYARVCLAPIQFGAGLKGKLLMAMQNGTPSVTTPIGAEGIAGDLDWSGYITQTPETFIEKALLLYSNKANWESMQTQGFRILNERFTESAFENDFKNKIANLQENLELHRSNNFIGSMFKHHLHQSTYYLSRFIEEKNKSLE